MTIQEAKPYTERLPKFEKSRLTSVHECFDYLLKLAENPAKNLPQALLVSDPVIDVFINITGVKSHRESENKEMILSQDPPIFNLGGGANVVDGLSNIGPGTMIARFGASDTVYGPIMKKLLGSLPPHIEQVIIEDKDAPNAVKIRYVDSDGQVHIGAAHPNLPMSVHAEEQIIMAILDYSQKQSANNEKIPCIVSDYKRGGITPRILSAISENINSNIFINPRPTNTQEDDKYNVNNAIIIANRDEAIALSNIKINDTDRGSLTNSVKMIQQKILDRFPKISGIIVTLDKDGAMSKTRDDNFFHHTHSPIHKERVKNPSGAGDILILTLAVLSSVTDLQTALDTAMWTAAESVTKQGTTTLNTQLILEAKERYELAHSLFYKSYSTTVEQMSGNFVPAMAAELMANEMGRKDLTALIADLLYQPETKKSIYPDVVPFLERIIGIKNQTLMIFTQGEIIGDNNREGYQIAKIKDSGLKEFFKEPVIGGHNKIAEIEIHAPILTSKFKNIVIIDDKIANIEGVQKAFLKEGITTQGYLINRKGVNLSHVGIPDNVTIIESFDEIVTDNLSGEDRLWLIDFDYTLSDHEKVKSAFIPLVSKLL